MDNMSCLEFLLLVYNWILEEFDEPVPQPVYIEMQPLPSRTYPNEPPPISIPIKQAPLIRQRKHVFAESPPETIFIQQTSESETLMDSDSKHDDPVKRTPQEDMFVTDFEIIEIADLIIKED